MELKLRNAIICLKLGDLTAQDTEAIVNAANPGLMGGGGVDGAIHRGGGAQILSECKRIINRIHRLEPGKAVITTGGQLRAKNVIHTVGPIWRGGGEREADVLAAAYFNSLEIARNNGIKTISFPSISTGAYGYPLDLAAHVALKTVYEYLFAHDHFDEIRFVLFNEASLKVYTEELLKEEYLSDSRRDGS